MNTMPTVPGTPSGTPPGTAPGGGGTGAPSVSEQERRRKKRGKGMTLRVNILTAFAALLSITVITLVAFAYHKNSTSVLELMGRFVERVSASGISSSMALLDPVETSVQATAQLAALDEAKARDGSLFPYMVSILRTQRQLQSLYLAFEADGRFLQAFPIPPGASKFGANDARPPEGSAFALRTVDRKGGKYSDVWVYVSDRGEEIGRETSDHLNYDPRPRPWYKDAIATRGLIWSDLLVYTSNRQPGITAAYPIFAADGRAIGAAAANVSTNQMSDFLAGLDLGWSGTAFIVDEKEQLIAHPDASRTVRQDGLKYSLVKADQLGEQVITDAFAAYHRNKAQTVSFDSGGQRHLGSFNPFPAELGKNWLMVIIVLEDDFVGTLKENSRDLVVAGFTVMVVGLLLVALLASWITRPLTLLTHEIQKIQRFELAGPIALHAIVAEVNELIHSMNMMKRALRTFGMFVPRDLVRELVASGRPIELGGQDKTLTVMFTDVADFTSLSERMAAGDLLVHVSRHLAAISECVAEEDGTVDKYVGDAVMAFWGAPIWRDDHALRGCIAALKAQRVQALMNAEWASQGLPTMFVRIGLHTAPVIVGNIGSAWRMSYTAMGDGVNVASRLEGVNKVYGTQICVSQAVLDAAGPSLLARPLDLVAVKGRKAGAQVYELMALREGDPNLAPTPEDLEICRLTTEGFSAYQDRRWSDAIALYEQLAALAPADKVPAIFIERCRHYLAEPPPADWTGLFEMKTK
ncbi:adenylate cyclase 1 [Paramagnetospirillum caucaseum]|uniref:Adenylate cyclase 1 n=1 Tax=Paramagnetospirillum caucaseum TaxID=1244869 RepID=M3AGB7_9PROT|nr:adenylate/guanylate cyclase domain-containing protein [Paramagnetospirillum caucaseum]EME71589.1 adenylate cyclase 1 [Paramagnetospirillum caucaseum]